MPKLPKAARPDGDGKAPDAPAEKPQPRTSGKRRRARRNGGVAVAEHDLERRRVDDAKKSTKAAKGATGATIEQAAVKPGDLELNDFERDLLRDLMAVIEEHGGASHEPIDRERVERSFVFACERHADQRRQSGEDFIVHPVGVAKICAGMRLDTATLCAALLHDTVEDTSASLPEVRDEFGEEIATLVDGVTKLTGITFQSRDDRQAENYRKMIVAMASDVRVILIKLADRLHNMRTIGAMP